MRWVASPPPAMSEEVQKSIFDISRSLAHKLGQAPHGSRFIFSCTEFAIFDTSRSTAPKLALLPGSRLYCDKCICYIKVCGKSHQD